ncbi:MAG: hypothetical protein PQJ44_02335 [Sphaerochaetaceae bacterium]|nr:hypothetical protein [Sphaerochaetaceae bacterium]
MKYINSERVVVYLIVFLLLLIPNLYFYLDQLIKFFATSRGAFWNELCEIIVYTLIIFYFSNFMIHIIMESNFSLEIKDGSFTYKTLLQMRRKNILYDSIKKIIICPETLVFKGEFESIIIVRKGCRRSLFFTQYSMKKDEYIHLKEIITKMSPSKVVKTEKKYIKPILALFSM